MSRRPVGRSVLVLASLCLLSVGCTTEEGVEAVTFEVSDAAVQPGSELTLFGKGCPPEDAPFVGRYFVRAVLAARPGGPVAEVDFPGNLAEGAPDPAWSGGLLVPADVEPGKYDLEAHCVAEHEKGTDTVLVYEPIRIQVG